MLSIRLSRVGKKAAPTYRVVVMPKNKDPWADNLEIVGHYNPRKNPSEIELKVDRIKYWLEQGAQPTDTVHNLLVSEKIIEDKKRSASKLSKKRKAKLGEKEAAAKEKAEAEAQAAKEKAEADAAAAEEAKKAEAEAPAEEKAEEPSAPAEEPKEETPAEEKAEETTEEKPAEDSKPVESAE